MRNRFSGASQWRSDGFLGAPPSGNTIFHRAWLEAHDAFPLGNGAPFSVELKDVIDARVVRLSQERCPSTVLRRVRPVDIDPIERETVRTQSHVREKGVEGLTPSLAHGDSALAVVGGLGNARIVAAGLCGAPRAVFPCPARAVFQLTIARCFAQQTSATVRQADSQRLSNYGFRVATRAATYPCGARSKTFMFRRSGDDRQTPEHLSE